MPEQLEALAACIRRYSPFDKMDQDYVDQLIAHAEIIDIEKGSLLFRRGKQASHCYFLISGTVDLISAGFESTTVSAGSERSKYALEDASPTRVSAVAKTDVSCLKVDSDFLDLTLAWSEASTEKPALALEDELQKDQSLLGNIEVEDLQHDWTKSLLSSPMLTKVPFAHIQKLFGKFERVSVAAGTEVIREGAPGDYFYVIDYGSAKVTTITGNTEIILERGQCFGEEALVANTPRNATVTMLTSGILMRLGKDDFKTLMHEPAQCYLKLDDIDMAAGDYVLVDVRTPIEFRLHNLPGSKNLPLSKLRESSKQLNSERRYVITPEGGRRSELAAFLLAQEGFETYLLTEE